MTRERVAQWGVAAGIITAGVGLWWLAPWLGLVGLGAGCVWFFLLVYDVDGER